MFAVMTKHNKSISLGLIRKQREAAGRQEAPRDEEEEEEKTKKTRRRRRRKTADVSYDSVGIMRSISSGTRNEQK